MTYPVSRTLIASLSGLVLLLATGELPEACFRRYLVQDYLFLIHFARAWGLAIYKSDQLAEMRC